METTRKDLHKLTERIQAVKSEKKKDSMAYTAAQKHFQAVCSGLSANDEGGTATLNEQLLCKSLLLPLCYFSCVTSPVFGDRLW